MKRNWKIQTLNEHSANVTTERTAGSSHSPVFVLVLVLLHTMETRLGRSYTRDAVSAIIFTIWSFHYDAMLWVFKALSLREVLLIDGVTFWVIFVVQAHQLAGMAELWLFCHVPTTWLQQH